MKKVLLLMLVMAPFSSLQAKKLYVNSISISPLESPQQGSKKLNIKIPRGAEVEQTETKNNWIKIVYGTNEGWVPAMVLTDKKPMEKVSTLETSDSDISKDARRRASGYTSAAAARGLKESGRNRVNTTQAPNYKALQKLEKNKADEKEAIEFISKDEKDEKEKK